MNKYDKREPNRVYAEAKERFMRKYDRSIKSLSTYHGGMETFICFEVLCANARAFARGDVGEIWKGAGVLDMNELCADVKMLDSLAQYNW
ncbi:MAG: hypothetical protein E7222_04215 [Clostridiales bacterium]|nr:hypothetical protein [Clostridiales bacterium]